MSKNKRNKPSVATYGDYEMITPPNTLREALINLPDGDDPVARAEAALSMLSDDYASWMETECTRLDTARRNIRAKGIDKARRDALFHAAHDIRGQAATLRYPLAAAGADSLCRLVEHTPDVSRIPIALIDQHVDAIRAIVREYARPDIAQIAAALNKRLRLVTDEFLAHENKNRPDVLANILAPGITPTE
ncbi:Hpt domain-containing protein [Bradyrhizobium sp.]|uniref:Hpt domain-containing protein n=1 Tax=Bradyrhizobium sp. TaxID=376 RepID=UPI0025C472EB|nr:Hpt domain-containing protein [Bradyrhizobium sp.]